MIDAHQHFWRLDRGDYGWLTPDLAELYRDFEPEHLAPLLQGAGIARTIAVQAAPTVAETRHLLALAATNPWVAGVVGWVALDAPDAPDALAALSGEGPLVGVRPMIQDLPDDDWMLGPSLAPGLAALAQLGLRFDALVLPRHLSNLLRLLEQHPELSVVIDHGAKPDIAAGAFDDWARDIARIARDTGAVCKLSGLVTEAGADWCMERLRPYVDHLLACFGPDRLLWGSDWPVVNLAGGFARWREASLELLAPLTEAERRGILGDNAARFYGLGVAPGSSWQEGSP